MTVRVAVVGCGAAARRLHLPGFRSAGCDVVAFSSRTRASAEDAAAEWGGGAVIDDWREAVELAGVDAVAVCTPNALHAPVAIAAAGAGKSVIVEKPIATTLADADAMIAAARAAGVVLAVAHNGRAAPPVAAARAAVASGALGTITSIRAVLRNDGPEMWSPGSSWFRDPALSGGGALIDLGVHLADAIRWITGDDLAEVSADVRGAPVEEEATVVFRLARGARGSFEVGWFEPAFALTIDGTGGRFEADASTTGEPGPDPWAAFARAIVEGTPPEPSGEDGRAALAAVRAAYDSAAAGSSIGMG